MDRLASWRKEMRRFLVFGALVFLSGGTTACSNGDSVDTTESDTDTDVDTDADVDGVEIAYDDGYAEEMLVPETETPDAQVAVRFTADSYPAELIGASFWIGRDAEPNTPFAVRVYASDGTDGKPGTELLPEPVVTECVFPGGNHWAEADLRGSPITVSADFYVAMDWTTAAGFEGEDAQQLGADYGLPDERSWWRWSADGKWIPVASIYPGVDRDAMIRAVVRYE